MNAIELTNVTKIYRRFGGWQFATLKRAGARRGRISALIELWRRVPSGDLARHLRRELGLMQWQSSRVQRPLETQEAIQFEIAQAQVSARKF